MNRRSRPRRAARIATRLALAVALGASAAAAALPAQATLPPAASLLTFDAELVSWNGSYAAGYETETDGLHVRSYPVRRATLEGDVERFPYPGVAHGFVGDGPDLLVTRFPDQRFGVWEADGDFEVFANVPIPRLDELRHAFATSDGHVVAYTALTSPGDGSILIRAAVYFPLVQRLQILTTGESQLMGLTEDGRFATYLALAENGGPIRVDLETGAEQNLHPLVVTGRDDVRIDRHGFIGSARYWRVAVRAGEAGPDDDGLRDAVYDVDAPRLILLPPELSEYHVRAAGGDEVWLSRWSNGGCDGYVWNVRTGALAGLPSTIDPCGETALLSGDGSTGVGRLPGGHADAVFLTPEPPPAIAPRERVCFAVPGAPADVAVINLTPVGASGAGDGQLLSSDVTTAPAASNVNYAPGTTDPNVALAPIGTDGRVCYLNSHHSSVHLIADHLGTITAAAYSPPTIQRVLDTRATTPLAPNGRACFAVTGSPGGVAVVNLTPVLAEGAGDGQLVSSDETAPPVASNVNYAPGSVDPNVALAPIGSDGRVCYVNSPHSAVDVIADHLGTIAAGADIPASTRRVLDTRNGGPVAAGGRACFAVSGVPGDVAVVNLTPVGAAGAGNGQLMSSDVATPPVASNVNFTPGSVDPNVALAPIGSDGRVCFLNSPHAAVHLVADHLGTIRAAGYTPAAVGGARVLDTRSGLGR